MEKADMAACVTRRIALAVEAETGAGVSDALYGEIGAIVGKALDAPKRTLISGVGIDGDVFSIPTAGEVNAVRAARMAAAGESGLDADGAARIMAGAIGMDDYAMLNDYPPFLTEHEALTGRSEFAFG